VGAGKNTSIVIPSSRKRRREGNPVVSDETVMYGYESSATLATDRLHYKLQTLPLVREGKNTSTVIPSSRKRRRKGNPVVSDETVIYGYESSATLTCTTNYRASSRQRGRPKKKRKAIVRPKNGGGNLVISPKGVPDTKTDRPTDLRS
jgi:hypothetical protein